jgi:protein-glutamine gamma-glutamyltransferase
MAVMLRTLGIPSQVAIGFLSGTYNPITGWQVVRASDAHSWVEAWLPSSGWTTFDPTPSDPSASSSEIAARMSMFSDAADQFWQNWVLSYDLSHQSALASRIQRATGSLGLSGVSSWISAATSSWRLLTWVVLAPGAAAILAIPLWPALKMLARRRAGVRRLARGEGEASDATMLYQRMLALLERQGFRKPASFTPIEFARALPMSEMSILGEDLTSAYNEFRFGGRRDVAPRMIRLLERLENMPSASSALRL